MMLSSNNIITNLSKNFITHLYNNRNNNLIIPDLLKNNL